MTAKKATREAKSGAKKPVTERLVDEALEDTFPASDPPFFVGGVTEPDTTKLDAPAEKEGQRPEKRDRH